ncbi:hypothetical protein I302_107948 [Kwoniella bestiolae CBS 10118]|uniref:D-glycerate 3-kinase n=1 Tax=Kwoniella bestiolae CBS 10118 TaxID=1296100 RepID=A0A1B9FX53_9TREE|nr:hypothetical protein I302_07688 [Kwoniella bestiolae CBS 10118]OCF23334.1 hypothetical protein I302_07688 [Kwoniella bestiolae CBS 10118]
MVSIMASEKPIDTSTTQYKAQLIAEFIAKHHERVAGRSGPLIVSMQGPQGAGKSTLAAALVSFLASAFRLRTAVASLDDFYLDRKGLDELAQASPNNRMLQGRGPPGTHDIELLRTVLKQIRGPERNASSVTLPTFDKSLYNGRGDRSESTIPIHPAELDVFMLEGWSLGFQHVAQPKLHELWATSQTAHEHDWQTIMQINDNLSNLNREIDSYFDCHVAITPLDLDYIYYWRLQQEHHMKRENRGLGMSDDEVRLFVDRYMPCYEVYGSGKVDKDSLRLLYGPEREVVQVEEDQKISQ